ncbi:MAG: alpha/beta hydrolase [Pseudomonadota bacterium]
MFEGFQELTLTAGDQTISLVTAGSGPPLLLLHGFPQTRAAWAQTAPLLTEHFTLVIPDLPGYGRSTCPPPDPQNKGQSKRQMADIMVKIMGQLGHEAFHLAGHDRGGRVAYRLTLDHPERVKTLTLLDIATTLDTWEAMDWQAAISAYHWPFLAQPAPLPERMIGADPKAYLHHLLDKWKGRQVTLNVEAIADYEAAIANPKTIEAMAEDYRAGASIDVEIDRESRAQGAHIRCPLQILRGTQYSAAPYRPAWLNWHDAPTEIAFDCGHFIAEEEPEATAKALISHAKTSPS